jgi:two-component system, cell cycle sensor histidine kinase and response regulator CckA
MTFEDIAVCANPSESRIIALIAEFDQCVAHHSFSEVVQGAFDFLVNRIGIPRASVALIESDGSTFRMFDSTLEVRGLQSGQILPHDSGSLGVTFDRRCAVYIDDIRNLPTTDAVFAALVAAGFYSTYTVPLTWGENCIGTLNAGVPIVDGIPLGVRQLMDLLAPRLAFAMHMGITRDALAESEARNRAVFEAVHEGVLVTDVSTFMIIMVNPAMCELLGYPVEALLGMTVKDVHPAEHLEVVLAKLEAVSRGQLEQAADIPMLRADGTVLLVDATARRTTVSGKQCVVGAFRDATPRRRREQEQLQLQQLEALGAVAAGIAHDFNNVLTGLIGNVSLAQMELDEHHPAKEILDEAQHAATRATALTRQLLTFAKGGTPVRKPTDIVRLVSECTALVSRYYRVQCMCDLPEGQHFVLGDEGQLTQVLQNLVNNAVDASPVDGTVRVAVSLLQGALGGEVCIEVSDDGHGILPEHRDRIFLPFFTTKKRSRGLGLAVALSIVRNHEGRIGVTSQPDVGTTFQVVLPAAAGNDIAEAPNISRPSGSGRVLVMDDEGVIRKFAERALRGAGYDVCLTTNGTQAVAAYRASMQSGEPFGVVILDLVVPGGVGGQEAAREILTADCKARIVVSSGYSDDAATAKYRDYGFCATLPKPYGAMQLCQLVEQLLRPSPG